MTLTSELAKLHSIFIDTAPIIYYIEAHPQFGPLAKQVVNAFQTGSLIAFSSVVTLVEVLSKPVKVGDTRLTNQFITFLKNGKQIRMIEISTDIAEQAGRLRGKYQAIRTMDAIQLAVALKTGADAFITNDVRLKAVTDIKILVLKDYLH